MRITYCTHTTVYLQALIEICFKIIIKKRKKLKVKFICGSRFSSVYSFGVVAYIEFKLMFAYVQHKVWESVFFFFMINDACPSMNVRITV